MTRKFIGILLIVIGIAIVAVSIDYWPGLSDVVSIIFEFAGIFSIGLGLVILGCYILKGLSVRDFLFWLKWYLYRF